MASEAIATRDSLAKKVISDVKSKLSAAKKGIQGLRKEELEARQETSEAEWLTTKVHGRMLEPASCPACESSGRLGMAHVRDKPAQISEDNEVLVTEIYATRSFECKVCGLKLDGVSELRVVELADHREMTYTQSPVDFFLIEHDYLSYDGPEYDNE